MRALERTVESLQGDLGKANKKIEELGRKSKSASGGVASLAKGLVAAAAAFVTVQKAADLAATAIRESVARDTAEKSLSLLAKDYGEVADAQLLVERAAKKFGQSQTEATKAISTTYARLRPLGATLTEIESVYNGFNTAARLSGATAAESAGAFRQLTQALGSGALRGDEFNSIAEQAPLLLQAVSKETGVAVGALRDYAAEGLITSDVVVRALERIEKEGAAGLAEALQTPEQAFKDLENAAEDLNVEVGRLLQPAVLEFVRALTEQFRQLTADIDKTRKAAEFLTEKLGFLADMGDAVAGAFDRMGIGFNDFVSNVIKNLPVIGAAVQMLEKLGVLRDNLAQAQDDSKGGRNFGADYAAQEKALFAAAGGFSPYKEGGGIASQFGGGQSKGAGKAAKASTKAADEMERQLKAGEDLSRQFSRQIKLLQTKGKFDKELLQNQFKLEDAIRRINETAAPLQREGLIGQAAALKDQQDVRTLEKAIEGLAGDVTNDYTKALKESNKELTQGEELLKGAYEIVSGTLTNSIQGLIDGTKEWGDILSDIASQLGSMFLNVGFKALGNGLFPGLGFANGGRPPTNQVSVVGERGPELFVPDTAGTVVSNEQSRAAMEQYSGGNDTQAYNEPMNINVETTSINGMEFITPDQFRKGIDQAASKGAKQGEQRAMNRLRQSRSTRSKIGI